GFVLAKSSGISFIDGLEQAEAVQTADGLAAGLAIVAALAVAAELLRWSGADLRDAPFVTGVAAVLVAGLAVPGMLSAGTHSHAGAAGHDHGGEAGEVASAVPPKPYDPTLPIDLGGVEGVTAQQQAAAENLLSASILALPR